MIIRNILFVCISFIAVVGCSSTPPKAEIAATAIPQEELNKFDKDIASAIAGHADVLASSDLKSAQSWAKEAKEDIASNKKQDEILNDIRTGRGFLNRAVETANERRPQIQGVLDAREAAVKAGARNFPKISNSMKSYDDDLRDEAANLGKTSPEVYSKMQSHYMDLELAAVQETNLGKARAAITGSIDSGAKRKAPKSLKNAETQLRNAENIISTNRKEPTSYAEAVKQANASAAFLKNVMATIQQHKNLAEPAAVEMVRKNMQIAGLKTNLNDANSETQELNQEIDSQGREIAQARKAISVQQALETARKEFSSSEADVFQQGDKLVVRLKSMQFTSGRSELPESSLALLAKVKDVAQSLNPSLVVVEGHTDSVGSPAQNQSLSQARAASVATYFGQNGLAEEKIDAVGYGFKKPIASNKSSDGRAQNRRVDIVITPAIEARTSL